MPFYLLDDNGEEFIEPVPVAATLGISPSFLKSLTQRARLFLTRQAQLHHRIHIGLDPVPKGYWSNSPYWNPNRIAMSMPD